MAREKKEEKHINLHIEKEVEISERRMIKQWIMIKTYCILKEKKK